MADYAKDSEKQAALRRQIENHPIWQYPPEERLQHNREWQSLYLLVFEFKEFLQKLENRLNNAGYDTGYLKQDEDAMLEWCKAQHPEFVRVSEKASWSDVKAYIKETGEIPDGVLPVEKPATFEVKVNG